MKNGWLRGVCFGSFVLLAIVVLADCGGGGNGDGGAVAVTYSISGQVTSNGSGLSGVTMSLTGASSATTITDASGNYTFTGLDNGSYTITPSRTGFTVSPTSSPRTVSGADIPAVNFTATPVPAVTYSISGQVASVATFSGLSGVTMTLSGASSATTITDANGNYTFTGLDNGSYTITPSRTGFTFSPTSSPRTVSGTDIPAVNFTATPVPAVTYSISGQVTSNGFGLSGVTMALTGASSATTVTDASGNYTFTGLDNGSFTITPSRTGFTFGPTSSPQTVSGVDITAVNFTTTAGPSAQVVPCPPSGTTIVTIQDFSFTPDNVTISANGIVKWTNNGPSTHTVTSGTTPTPDGVFNSGILGTGATVCVQFLGIGTAQYFCELHPTMTGIVTVTGGDPCLACWDY